MNAMQLMDARDEAHRATLERIGQEIGYGRAQQMLGELWDAMLDREYPPPPGVSRSGRGRSWLDRRRCRDGPVDG